MAKTDELIRYVTGDITAAPQRVIAHGCNRAGVMGAGVALAIVRRWPAVKFPYHVLINSGASTLGDVAWAETGDGRWIAHAITQLRYGRDKAVRYASYDAIDKALRQVVQGAHERRLVVDGKLEIAIPRIGAGLGGASWDVVERIVIRVASELGATFVIYDLTDEEHVEEI